MSHRHSNILRAALLGLLAGGSLMAGTPAWALSSGERITQLEQNMSVLKAQVDSLVTVVAGANASRQATESLLTQVEALQKQVRDLQGQIEVAQHKDDEARQAVSKQMEGLDRRIRLLEDKANATPGAEAAAPAVPGATASSATPGIVYTPPAPNTTTAPAISPASPLASSSGAMPAAPRRPPAALSRAGNEQGSYDAAFKELKAGRFEAALTGFSTFVKQYPMSGLAPNAYYWMGYLENALGRTDAALRNFQIVIARYPNTDKAPDAMYQRAGILEDTHQTAQARALYNQLLNKYPASRAADMARKKLGRIKG